MSFRALLIGTILGDGYLEKHGRGIRLCIRHAKKFRDYVEWKHNQLSELSLSPMRFHDAKYSFWYFKTKAHPILQTLHEKFYVQGKKVVPQDIKELLVDPMSLAVWYMDDGTLDRRQGSALFETQCFLVEEVEKLSECLNSNFRIQTRIHRSGKDRGLRLYVSVRETRKLAEIIKPYVLPVFRYKLPYIPVTTDS